MSTANSAQAHLAQYGVSLQEAIDYINQHLTTPDVIYNVSKQFRLTNAHLAEITGYAESDVKAFWSQHGLNPLRLDVDEAFQKELQKVMILGLGRGANEAELEWLMSFQGDGDWMPLVEMVNSHMAEQVASNGLTQTVQYVAQNGLGLQLSVSEAESVGQLVSSGQMSWAEIFIYCMNLTDESGFTLSHRAQAAHAFLDDLSAANKSAYFKGAAVEGAVKNLIQAISASTTSLANGEAGLDALSIALSEQGIQSAVIDGYIRGATVFVDANGDGIRNPGEFTTTTNAAGNYTLPANTVGGKIIATGGTDILTGKAFQGVLTAPAGATVVNPITTLVESLVAGGQSMAAAKAAVQSALGLPADINLLSYDPLAVLADGQATEGAKATALAVQSVAIQVANVITQASALIANASDGVSQSAAGQAVITAIANSLSGGQAVSLANVDTLASIINASATSTGATSVQAQASDLAQMTSAINALAASATNITQLAQVATVGQHNIVEALTEASASGNTVGSIVSAYTGNNLNQSVNNVQPGEIAPGLNVPPPGGGQSGGGETGGGETGGGETGGGETGGSETGGGETGGGETGGGETGGGTTPPATQSVWANELTSSAAQPANLSASNAALTLKVDPRFGSHVSIDGFGSDDVLQLPAGAEALLSVASASGDVSLITNYNGIVSHIQLNDIVSSSDLVYDTLSFNALPVGNVTFNGSQYAALTSNLDLAGGSLGAPSQIDAAIGAFAFSDAANTANVVRITGFGADDSLSFTGVSAASDIAVSSQNGNVSLSVNQGGTLSAITLMGVTTAGQIIYDLASFNALPVGDILI